MTYEEICFNFHFWIEIIRIQSKFPTQQTLKPRMLKRKMVCKHFSTIRFWHLWRLAQCLWANSSSPTFQSILRVPWCLSVISTFYSLSSWLLSSSWISSMVLQSVTLGKWWKWDFREYWLLWELGSRNIGDEPF